VGCIKGEEEEAKERVVAKPGGAGPQAEAELGLLPLACSLEFQ